MTAETDNLGSTLLADGRAGVRKMVPVTCLPLRDHQPSTINDQPPQPVLDFLASTGTVDRFQEIIDPEGWKLDNYRLNPVFQNAHRYGDVLFTLGKALVTEVRDIGEGRKGLYQRIEFATECNPIAKVAYGLYQGGFLNAVSVGFIPLRWEDAEGTIHTSRGASIKPSTIDHQPSTTYRRRYLEQELLEVSAVAIPANSEALALGLAEGAITRSAVQEAIDVLGATLGGKGDHGPRTTDHGLRPATLSPQLLWNFARELRAAMRK